MIEPSHGGNDNDPFGGNILIEGGAELLFPMPFIKDQKQVALGVFSRCGNVFDTSCRVKQRIALMWTWMNCAIPWVLA